MATLTAATHTTAAAYYQRRHLRAAKLASVCAQRYMATGRQAHQQRYSKLVRVSLYAGRMHHYHAAK